MNTSTFVLRALILTCLSALSPGLPAAPAGTAFTYQGRLNDTHGPVNGTYDFFFSLYDSATGDTGQIGPSLPYGSTPVSNGLFTLTLDFGNPFSSNATWLQISVRTNGASTLTNLSPRQLLTPAPYALFATTASILSGTVPDARLSTNVSLLGQTIESAEITDGTIVNADIASGAAIADTKLATLTTAGKVANSATTATTNNVADTLVARDALGDFNAGLIHVQGVDVTGYIRSGSETGTSEPPFVPAEGGLILRRFDSSVMTSGSIVARTDSCTLVRDGTAAGLRINYTNSNEKLSFNAIGLSFYGTNVNFRSTVISSASGFVQLFNNAQRVVHAQISFGDVYGAGGAQVTQVVMDRFDSAAENDFYLTGTITSTYNQ